MFRRFGAEVTVIEKSSHLLSHEDEDISDGIREILEAEGIRFELEAECVSLARDGEHIAVGARCGEQDRPVRASHVLIALGRNPNTDDLGLDAVGIRTGKKGHIEVDDQCRTSVEGVWAVGECNGHGPFTHTAYNDHEIVVANLFDNDPRRISDRIQAYALYIDPPLGRMGMTEQKARDSGRKLLRRDDADDAASAAPAK